MNKDPVRKSAPYGRKKTSESITVLDLFSGAGGLTQGFYAASPRFVTERAVEFEPAAAASFAATFGDKVYAGPIQDWLVNETVPDVDIVIGGPPCQGFSQLGKQDPEDIRNSLWQPYAAALSRAKPKYFIVENVPAFSKSQQLQDFRDATAGGGLIEEYDFQWHVLNAADYGAPQARKRAILIGHHKDLPFPGFPMPTHIGRHRTVRQALKGINTRVAETLLPDRSTEYAGRSFAGTFRTSELHLGRDYAKESLERFGWIPEGGNRFNLPDRLKAPCWRKHKTGSGDVMGRMHWDRPSVTVRTEFFKPEKGRYLHPTEHRAITHLEAAKLQGFPEDRLWVGSKTAIAKQIGNAVPTALGKAIAAQLLQNM
ncbi:DNA cytosine methyltransferase [Pseudarthrobacter raffinosi]|uniref:DNA cytosine methyltransferase n=1 Tax=Pseudarthrobacter raffinosi TaxID=2953651 RepID=UPI00208E4AA1|nr:DNA cytosine methyltransferase [Pseudarthrobacter sp. MDT3-9]MCO4249528.1 DNA cytosine methyltransferase [Pseudarthrobacter sp. MDT3-9]